MQRVERIEAEQDVDVAQPEIGVQHQHSQAAFRQGVGEVGDDIGLAHPALSGGDREDLETGLAAVIVATGNGVHADPWKDQAVAEIGRHAESDEGRAG